ncbi:hypothetical protein DL766_004725 [Monosporascus sp. MC13-8B]|uniref:Serine hydrolase domain-containing protein n=1 Tax=Monosporascus cannonballus TaxID=155416 RepID=A0ABY0HGU9_9PEZI|nr:hypothetical protein DL762_002218 [Monosporascus cannonballus]RYP01323.1 hypothetical protein DL763_000295 [Monosporascus cannonballus]RYP30777.1 hypothetical protein DL766_004725 [Monosporascus sp. MC13-8B]
MGFSTRVSQPTKAILCIHGGGASPEIFRFQTSSIRAALDNKFDFVYATAPHIAPPGPDVLPFFAGMEPYYSWFRVAHKSTSEEVDIFNEAIKKTVDDWQRRNPQSTIAGILGFSQGGVASTVLLWEQQVGLVPWLPQLKFGIIVCSGFSDVATGYMRDYCMQSGYDEDAMVIKLPTLHLHGRQDGLNLPQSRKMFATHYAPTFAALEEFDGQHEVPKKIKDVKKVVNYILSLPQ